MDKVITFCEWEESYQPIYDEYALRDFKPLRELAVADSALFHQAQIENRVWTEVDEGDAAYILPSLCLVNSMSFYITKKPYVDDVLIELEE